MNKKLITLAVASAMAVPAAVNAEAIIYGTLHQHIDYVDVDANAIRFGAQTKPSHGTPVNASLLIPDTIGVTFNEDGVPVATEVISGQEIVDDQGNVIGRIPFSKGFKGWDINGNNPANRIGIKGSEDLGGGLKAIYQVEMGVWLSDRNGSITNGDTGALNFRNSFVGLAGNFGTLLVGRHDTPYKIATGKLDLFADTLADMNYTIGFHDIRADNTIAYISPSFSGFQFAGAVIPSGGNTPLGYPTTIEGVGEAPDGLADAWSVAGIYKNGPFYASLAYENLGEKHWSSTLERDTIDRDGVRRFNYLGVPNYGSADDYTKWKLGLGLLDWNGFTLTGIYESSSHVFGAPKKSDQKNWQIQAGYSFGNNTIKGMYGQSDTEECVGAPYALTCAAAVTAATGEAAPNVAYLNQRDHDSWGIAFDHNFSKRTRAYMLYTQTTSDQDNSDWSGFSLGMIHKF